MFEVTRDEQVFKTFWKNDATKTPRWFNDGVHAWDTSWDDFRGFCFQCERIYLIDEVALLYVERIGTHANIHFSLLRGEKIEIDDLIKIRMELLLDFEMIFGWCGAKNRGLKRFLEQCGLHFDGFRMWKGVSHGKIMEWHCYSIRRDELFVRKSAKDLLVST